MNNSFILLFALVAFFLPAITVGTTPIPIMYGIAGFYVLFRPPSIPNRQLGIFAVAVVYLSLIAAKNAIDERGDFRDFLYVFICFGQMLTFCMLKDQFDRGHGDRILSAMTVLASLNLILMIFQIFDIFGVDESLLNLWAIPWELVKRDDFVAMHASSAQTRPFGLMGGFNVASTAMYLVFRAGWVRYRKQRSRVLSLLSILVTTSRMLTLFFALYEVVIPLFSRRQRRGSMLFLIVGGIVTAVGIFVLANYVKGFLLINFFRELSSGGLSQNYSYTNRLASVHMALDNVDKIFLFGGIHSEEFLNLSRAVDSELLLRSLQFGWFGFLVLVLMLYYYFDKYRSMDMLFLPALMLWTSITFTGASNFVFTPFFLVYGFVCRDDFLRRHRKIVPAATGPQRAAGVPVPTT
jgi:hypothetical protein